MAQEVTVKVYIEKLSKLVHSGANPRLITPIEHKKLMDSLKEFPEMKLIRELVVDENLLILAGDKRAYALEELGYSDVTIKQVFGLTEKQKREFIAKDNVHNGDWDPNIIANQWNPEEMKQWGVPAFTMPGEETPKKEKTKKSREVECPDCGTRFDPSEQ